ncbi:hypothetical protein F4780DRAFT_779097 [Xylariomycetidae sp. FL0641]|nr:hypothetical protein F4780DRAFT_779097 [Xylariomycetidae sp. FL0641]
MRWPPGRYHRAKEVQKEHWRTVGDGTIESPKITWRSFEDFDMGDEIDRNLVEKQEQRVIQAAKNVGCTHGWIIKEEHGTMTKKVRGYTQPLPTTDDFHITARLGRNPHRSNLTVHVYENDPRSRKRRHPDAPDFEYFIDGDYDKAHLLREDQMPLWSRTNRQEFSFHRRGTSQAERKATAKLLRENHKL